MKFSLDLLKVMQRITNVSIVVAKNSDELIEEYNKKQSEKYTIYNIHKLIKSVTNDLVKEEGLVEIEDSSSIRHTILFAKEIKFIIGPYLILDMSKRTDESETEQIMKSLNFSLPQVQSRQIYEITQILFESLQIVNTDIFISFHKVSKTDFVILDYSTEDIHEHNFYQTILEHRYKNERFMMRAVQNASPLLALKYFSQMSDDVKNVRYADDPVVNDKISSHVLKTMCRIAAVQGGKSPIAVDILSHRFTNEIMKASSVKKLDSLKQEIILQYAQQTGEQKRNYSTPVSQCVSLIKEAYFMDLTAEAIASHVGYNKNYLNKKMKEETGMSLMSFLNEVRMREAVQLLLLSNFKISDIASRVGILDNNLFSRKFKEYANMTPTEYRNQKFDYSDRF